MNTQLTKTPLFKRYGLLLAIAGVVAVLSANGLLVYFALGTWTGLETEQPYVKGLNYNDNISGATRQQALGWTVALSTAFDEPKGQTVSGNVSAAFTAADGSALTGLAVRLDAIRPTHEGFDRSLTLAHQGRGIYSGRVDFPLRGQWNLRIQAQDGAKDFQQTQRIITP